MLMTTKVTVVIRKTMMILKIYLITRFLLTLNLPTTTIVAEPFNIIKWQMKFNPVA